MAQRPPLTLEDKLSLSQVVYECGTLDWIQVSAKFVEWSTIRGKSTHLSPQECEFVWNALMQQAKALSSDPAFTERTRMPHSPMNLELVKGLFRLHLTELHKQIVNKENMYHSISNEIDEILSGARDDKIVPKTTKPEVVAPLTASSSSSQLSSIDSPTPAEPSGNKASKSKEDDESSSPNVDEGMDVDEHDITLRQDDSMDIDDEKVQDNQPGPSTKKSSAPAPAPAKVKVKEDEDMLSEGSLANNEGDEDGDGEDEEAPSEPKEEPPPPARGLRSRKTLEPLEIPVAPVPSAPSAKSPRKTRGRGVSNAQPPQHSPRVQRRRDGQDTTSKAPQSPTAASVAETLDSPVAATDENASVVDDGGGNLRRSNRAHKRRASEMDVELPPPSLKISEHSATVEEEPMTPAIALSGSGRVINPKTRQAMSQMVALLMGSKHAEIFQRPVTKKDAPDYAQAVLRPTDLSTIQKSIKAGVIATWEELERDLTRMLANSCVYNKPGTDAYESAKAMLKEVEENLEAARESNA